jgi:hypothetical protein
MTDFVKGQAFRVVKSRVPAQDEELTKTLNPEVDNWNYIGWRINFGWKEEKPQWKPIFIRL